MIHSLIHVKIPLREREEKIVKGISRDADPNAERMDRHPAELV
jgi:hypothetical protein